MARCDACNKSYTTVSNLNKHLRRQPLCERWMRLRPGLKDYVEDAFEVQQQYTDQDTEGEDAPPRPSCPTCSTSFANAGNLTRHMQASGSICAKWAMYSQLEPISMWYARFEPPGENAGKMMHIIWNVFLVDKDLVSSEDFAKVVKEERIAHVVGIIKADFEPRLAEIATACGIGHTAVVYKGNSVDSIDRTAYDVVCDVIDGYRAPPDRRNVVVFCNSGYQRSIPLLAYYLLNRHSDECPDVERSIDLILPQVDRANYAKERGNYIDVVRKLVTFT